MPQWDGGRCAPVQNGLRRAAATKRAETQAGIDELTSFAADLRRILDRLGSHTPPGPCDADCGCLGPDAPSRTASPSPARARTAVACTLAEADVPRRVNDWHELLAHTTGRRRIEGGVRLELDRATPVAELVRLVEAERSCCRFLAFAITIDERGLALEVRAPSDAQELVDGLFGGRFTAKA